MHRILRLHINAPHIIMQVHVYYYQVFLKRRSHDNKFPAWLELMLMIASAHEWHKINREVFAEFLFRPRKL